MNQWTGSRAVLLIAGDGRAELRRERIVPAQTFSIIVLF